MCIILYKPKGARLPSKKTLQICFANNNDGAGLTVINKNCRSRKGFMEFQDLWAAYRNECFTSASEFALHFRLATAGDISKGNCHPFPIINTVRGLRQKKFKSNQIIMHNGILGWGSHSLSDTMLYVKNELYALRNHLKNPGTIKYIKRETWGSKLLIIDHGKVTMTGFWVKDKETGIMYSNTGYKKLEITFTYVSNDNKFDNYNNHYDYVMCPGCYEYDEDFFEFIELEAYPGEVFYECLKCSTVFDEHEKVIIEGDSMEDEYNQDMEDECPICFNIMKYDKIGRYWVCENLNCNYMLIES